MCKSFLPSCAKVVNFAVMEKGDFSYIDLKPQLPENPCCDFINADEIFTLTVAGDFNVVARWTADWAGAIGIRRGARVSARSIVRLLRELPALAGLKEEDILTVYQFPPLAAQDNKFPQAAPKVRKSLRTFASTSSLIDIISSRLDGGDSDVEELIVAPVTAVPLVQQEVSKLHEAPMPEFEVDTPAVAPSSGAPLLTKESLYGGSDDEEPENDDEEPVLKPKRRRSSVGVFLLLAAVALVAGWVIVRYLPEILPQNTGYDTMESTDVTQLALEDNIESHIDSIMAAEPVDTTAAVPLDETKPEPASAQENVATAEETSDLSYLNSNRVWKRADLKSQKYLEFFDLFAKGDIRLLAESDYFATEGVASNRNALKAIDLLWKALGSPTQASNEKVLRALKGKKEIDLWKLQDTLARYRDSNFNKTPRPKR